MPVVRARKAIKTALAALAFLSPDLIGGATKELERCLEHLPKPE